MQDHRTECRYAIESACKVRLKDQGRFIEVEGLATELSSRGIRVALHHPVPAGQVICVELALAPNHKIFGQVVHTRPMNGEYEVGLKVVEGVLPFSVFRKLIEKAKVVLEKKTEPAPAKPSPTPTPECFIKLGLDFPASAQEIHLAFRKKAMKAHPDHGGSEADFVLLHNAMEEALRLVGVSL